MRRRRTHRVLTSVSTILTTRRRERSQTLSSSGTFPHYAARFVDPAFGFAVGWNYFYTSLLTVPVEVTAGTLILSFWDDDAARQVLYTSVLIACTIFINVFGESTPTNSISVSSHSYTLLQLCGYLQKPNLSLPSPKFSS